MYRGRGVGGGKGDVDPRPGNPRASILRHITIQFTLFTTFAFLPDLRLKNQKLREMNECLNNLAMLRPLRPANKLPGNK